MLHIDGGAIQSTQLAPLVHDIALLNSLGVKLVIIHGSQPQIEARYKDSQHTIPTELNDTPISQQEMQLFQDGVNSTRNSLEAALSMGLPNSPMAGMSIRVVSGNFLVARPRGIIDGADYGHAGRIRRLDSDAIQQQLMENSIVVLSPLGYSRTGEVFYLDDLALAEYTANALKADKLIWLGEEIQSADKQPVKRQLNIRDAQQLTLNNKTAQRLLDHATHACDRGIKRVHLLPWKRDGALLQELFTRDGVGIMISGDNYDAIRQANIDDAGGILELIQPLEQAGVLARRSREHLEMEISHFTVMERDGAIVACSALYPFTSDKSAELACVAVHEDYQHKGRGEQLLNLMESIARKQGIEQIFLLTTQATHWFIEHGFVAGALDDLPVERKSLYNFQRNSAVLVKKL